MKNRVVRAGVVLVCAAMSGCAPGVEVFQGAPVCANTATFILTGTVNNQPLEGTTTTGMGSMLMQGATSTFNLVGANSSILSFQATWNGTLADGQVGVLTSASALIPDGVYAGMRLCATSGSIRIGGPAQGGGQVVLQGLSFTAANCPGPTVLPGQVKGCFK